MTHSRFIFARAPERAHLPSLLLALSVAILSTACAGNDKNGSDVGSINGGSCDEDEIGTECVCTETDEDGLVECVDDALECVCDGKPPAKTDDEDDEKDPVTPPKKDAGTKDAGKEPATPAKDGGSTKDAGTTPTTTPDGGGTPTTPVVTTGDGPKVPEVKGECPEFKNGTMMIGGHKNVAITAGAPGKGGPIVFYWHGTGSSAGVEQRNFAGISDVVAQGGIFAAFNSSGSAMGGGGNCSGTNTHFPADFDAADQIVACGVKNHGIDPKKIYTTGCSAGGLQAGCMAQMRSSYIAAVAPNSGGIVAPKPWQDAHAPAVMTMHGGSSDMVIVTFSQTSAAFDMNAKAHGSLVVNCDHGGRHCAAPSDLQKAAWKFMQDHPFGFADSPWKTAIPSGVPSYCKIF